jgi:hypothetical protein
MLLMCINIYLKPVLRYKLLILYTTGSIPGGVTLGIFSVATDGTTCRGVDSASKNEYQGFLLGVKAAGA